MFLYLICFLLVCSSQALLHGLVHLAGCGGIHGILLAGGTGGAGSALEVLDCCPGVQALGFKLAGLLLVAARSVLALACLGSGLPLWSSLLRLWG